MGVAVGDDSEQQGVSRKMLSVRRWYVIGIIHSMMEGLTPEDAGRDLVLSPLTVCFTSVVKVLRRATSASRPTRFHEGDRFLSRHWIVDCPRILSSPRAMSVPCSQVLCFERTAIKKDQEVMEVHPVSRNEWKIPAVSAAGRISREGRKHQEGGLD